MSSTVTMPTGQADPHPAARQRDGGFALVLAILIVLTIASVLMVFARQMQTEAVAASNAVSKAQARLIAEGVARAVVGELAIRADASDSERVIEAEAGRIGDGLYWIIRPSFEDDLQHDFGLMREAGKVNINTAPRAMLAALPGMDDEIAAAIIDWRDRDTNPTDNGAESDYYLSLPQPYYAKDGPFETIEELRLVRGVTREVLFGEDWNRNGVLDPVENDAADRDPPDNADGRLERGLYAFVTVYSREPNQSPSGNPKINLNTAAPSDIARELGAFLEEDRVATLVTAVFQRPFASVLDYMIRAGATADEAVEIESRFTTTSSQMRMGLIDITTAPAPVLDALPGLEQGDGELIVAARGSASDDSLLWLVDAIGEDKGGAIGALLTTRSYQYTADIVALSGDGRGFCRLRVTVDAAPDRGNTRPRIVYIQDLNALGWPLDPDIPRRLRAGETAAELAGETIRGAGS